MPYDYDEGDAAFSIIATLFLVGICVAVFLSGHWVYHLIWS